MSETSGLENAVESWQQSVAFDRGQVKYDLILFATGTLLTGFDLGVAVCGVPEGLVALAPGGIMGGIGVTELRDDINRLSNSITTLAARQQELEQTR
jgi:hypothetical protein